MKNSPNQRGNRTVVAKDDGNGKSQFNRHGVSGWVCQGTIYTFKVANFILYIFYNKKGKYWRALCSLLISDPLFSPILETIFIEHFLTIVYLINELFFKKKDLFLFYLCVYMPSVFWYLWGSQEGSRSPGATYKWLWVIRQC